MGRLVDQGRSTVLFLYFAEQLEIARQVVKAFRDPAQAKQFPQREVAQNAQGDFFVRAK